MGNVHPLGTPLRVGSFRYVVFLPGDVASFAGIPVRRSYAGSGSLPRAYALEPPSVPATPGHGEQSPQTFPAFHRDRPFGRFGGSPGIPEFALAAGLG